VDGNKFELLGPAMSRIGEEAMHIVGGKPDGVFLYVEIGDRWVDPSLFKDEGDSVRYHDIGPSNLWRLLIDAWCIEPVDKRWTAMEYTIDGGKFDAKFSFDDVEKESVSNGSDARRQRVLRARYGDKPIVYPPPSPDMKPYKPGP
jgi:hypothetical protein